MTANNFLKSLSAGDQRLVFPHLHDVELKQGNLVFDVGDTIGKLYFPESGIISFVVTLMEGNTVEAGMVGKDGVVGSAAALCQSLATTKAIVQAAGRAKVLDIREARKAAGVSIT